MTDVCKSQNPSGIFGWIGSAIKETMLMPSILRCTLAALAVASTVWLAATPATADDIESCAKTSGDESIAACTRAINLGRHDDPEFAFLFNNRCIEWVKKQESDKAIEDCSQAIRLQPDFAWAFNNRGGAYLLKDQYDRAIEDFDQAIRLCPDYASAFYNRALSWERKSDLQRALADFKKFAELDPSDPDGPEAIKRVTKASSRR
jgi:tetratricopeptide (TPR) repeat protein